MIYSDVYLFAGCYFLAKTALNSHLLPGDIEQQEAALVCLRLGQWHVAWEPRDPSADVTTNS